MLDTLLFIAIGCPVLGMLVMFGGHALGTMFEAKGEDQIGPFHKYGLLVGLGLATYVLHVGASGQY